MSYVVVYRPMDEVTARALLAALQGQRIPARLRVFHNPWEISWLEGNPWGEILVPEENQELAREMIAELLSSTAKNSDQNDAT